MGYYFWIINIKNIVDILCTGIYNKSKVGMFIQYRGRECDAGQAFNARCGREDAWFKRPEHKKLFAEQRNTRHQIGRALVHSGIWTLPEVETSTEVYSKIRAGSLIPVRGWPEQTGGQGRTFPGFLRKVAKRKLPSVGGAGSGEMVGGCEPTSKRERHKAKRQCPVSE